MTPEDQELIRLVDKYKAGDVHDCNVEIGFIRGVYWARERVKDNPNLQKALATCEELAKIARLACRIFIAHKKLGEPITMRAAKLMAKEQ